MKGIPFITAILSSLAFASALGAENPLPSPQYRFGSDQIPGATAEEPLAPAFSSEAARSYLDRGAALWAKQKNCVSCHTHGIYMATRPALSRYWGKPAPGTRPFFVAQAGKLEESEEEYNASTPVQSAYIARGLAAWDEAFHESTSPETDAALRHMFAEMQATNGSIVARDRWPPLNSTTYHGTAMAAMAVATAPLWRANLKDKALVAGIEKLERFLRDTPPANDHERLLLLWVSTRLPGVLDEKRKNQLIEMIWSRQRPDGGWSIRNFATLETWGGGRKAEQLVAEPDYDDPPSDGYQTGLAVIVLRDAGVPAEGPGIQKAVRWLLSNQRASGRWWTRSLNTTSRFHYITYSGTAYAALALAKCGALEAAASR